MKTRHRVALASHAVVASTNGAEDVRGETGGPKIVCSLWGNVSLICLGTRKLHIVELDGKRVKVLGKITTNFDVIKIRKPALFPTIVALVGAANVSLCSLDSCGGLIEHLQISPDFLPETPFTVAWIPRKLLLVLQSQKYFTILSTPMGGEQDEIRIVGRFSLGEEDISAVTFQASTTADEITSVAFSTSGLVFIDNLGPRLGDHQHPRGSDITSLTTLMEVRVAPYVNVFNFVAQYN